MATLSQERLSDVCVFRFSGDLDVYGTGQVQAAYVETVERVDQHVVVDLSEVAYVSSLALAMFNESSRTLKRKGRRLVFCGLQAEPRQIFELTRLDRTFAVCDSIDQAIAALDDRDAKSG